jgi:hypothetical protein
VRTDIAALNYNRVKAGGSSRKGSREVWVICWVDWKEMMEEKLVGKTWKQTVGENIK